MKSLCWLGSQEITRDVTNCPHLISVYPIWVLISLSLMKIDFGLRTSSSSHYHLITNEKMAPKSKRNSIAENLTMTTKNGLQWDFQKFKPTQYKWYNLKQGKGICWPILLTAKYRCWPIIWGKNYRSCTVLGRFRQKCPFFEMKQANFESNFVLWTDSLPTKMFSDFIVVKDSVIRKKTFQK